MSVGNIRMNNINMNKYDATNAMSSGTSSKMSMDMQQMASNENSVKAGSDVQQYEKKGLTHEGTTFMRNQDGELLRMTGNFKQTGGAWNFDGNVQNLSTGETFKGNMSGMAKDMNSMQQGLNVDDISMTGKERANLGDVKGKDVAFIQGTVVDSNLSASNVTHKDNISTENTVDQKNYNYERTTDIDTSRTEKHNDIYENKKVIDNSKTDTDLTKIERGTVISDQGKSYSYNSSAIAQDIQSKHDANGSLDLIRQKYENMKEMEASGNPMAVAARADYEKAITAYSMAAAQGLPISSSVGEGDDFYKSKDVQHYQDANWQAGGSGNAGPISAGGSYSEGEKNTNSFGSTESSQNKVSLDTTALKIRDAIENGFDSGVSNGKILNSLGDRATYR